MQAAQVEGTVYSKGRNMSASSIQQENLLLSPLVLPTDLVLFLGSEVILDVESLANLLGGLALDHVRNGLAADVKEGLDIKVIGGQNDFEQHLLVNLHELLVPLIDICGLAARVIIVTGAWGVALVVSAPLENLLQDCLVDLEETGVSFVLSEG